MITLIGDKLAQKGLIFQYIGPAEECLKCRFKGTCTDSLEKGRMYIIKDVKNAQQKCNIHETNKVKVVEVEKAHIKSLVDTKSAFEGSIVSLNPPMCDEDCQMHELCFPEGLKVNDKCKIIKNLGKADKKCLKGYNLSKVLLKC
ncbi:UPF0179 family protein [Methanobacterium alkalithermotolerans]|uniref:UPF0179 protein HYG87_09675 n=1 Tax=Methanobacterium alkalithermotolerans TaxID=2731220 RepID=A0A8T8K8W0_9EURY|nr:UPF0179 family protein [Methanobacterium alkalithermotolerans]QUH24005.1 UPF0179 family protein [Methanobacterium alkalithermotolerans]RJS48424.1 MAG: hypothetical protein CIT03_08150 [Methanobacterium sp.]